MNDSLKKKTMRALIWSGLERFGYQGIRALITLVLARLLTPDDFGIIGILLVFIIIAEAIINNGFGQAVIQKKDISEDDLTTAFLLSLVMSIILYFVIYLASPTIALFYERTELISFNRVLALVIVFDSLVVIQQAKFQREMDFKSLSLITIVSSLISGIIGVILAFFEFGVWALIAQMLGQKMIMAAYLWIKSNWVPKGKLTKESLRHMFSYGWKLQVSGVLSQSFRHINSLIIGKTFSVDLVGYYTQAKNLKDLPMVTLSSIINKVAFPVFSSIQDDKDRLKKGYKTSIKMLVFISFPLMIGLAATAENLIPVLLGEQWEPSIKFFQLLCFAGMIYPMQTSNINILKVTGRTDLYLKLELFKKLVTISAIIISIRWGIYALIIAQVISSYINLGINASFSGKLINYSLREQVADCIPFFVMSLLMGIVVSILEMLLTDLAQVIVLLVQIISGMTFYFVLCKMFRVKEISILLNLINKKE
ncbi:MAG: lipopolysaccharide biosynthesis protein [Spirochaetales bacterium]|uniref:Lipopolysaccharide biosynthesis protein n=1 Tax=Candidatus Thalassospirochaeta sargassi TaxID=3119039 RepID=A0AAJ1IBD1_9SPIO|nr:lipopolysaccharide biosynthesis protein [Spirochaetales bacterium]